MPKRMSWNKKKELALTSVEDLVAKLLFYDRKEDEELSKEDLDKLLADGKLTIDEIVERFRKTLEENT